jgi:hypothetical protein
MCANQTQGSSQQGLARFELEPGRQAGGVGQGDDIGLMVEISRAMCLADDIVQARCAQHLGDGQLAHRNDQLGLEQMHFLAQPLAAVGDLVAIRDTVAALGVLAREAAAHGGHVDTFTELLFGDSQAGIPLEQGLAGGPGEGPAERTLIGTGGLADLQDLRGDRPADDHRAGHGRGHRVVDGEVVHVEDDVAVVGGEAGAPLRLAAELDQLAARHSCAPWE